MTINSELTLGMRPCMFPVNTFNLTHNIGSLLEIVGRGLLTGACLFGLSFLGVLPAILIYMN